MDKAEIRDAVLAGLAIFATIYILLLLGDKLLASFLAFAGVTGLGARLAKYKMQLEVFDAVIYVGTVMVAISIMLHFAQILGLSGYFPSALNQFVQGASPALETALAVFAALAFSQSPTKPSYYSWLAFLCVMDLTITHGMYMSSAERAIWLVVGLAILAICLGAFFGIGLKLTVFNGAFTLVIAMTGFMLAAQALAKVGYNIPLPSWLIYVANATLLAMVVFMFIVYLVVRANPTYFLAGASIFALSAYGLQGIQLLLNIALFSIAVFVVIAVLGMGGGGRR